MPDFLNEAQELLEFTQFLRRDFHRHPELGFQEVRTAGIVSRELNAMGYEVSTGIGKTGVVALLESDRPGPVVLVRFDMDALPIQEENQTDYISQTTGIMHACGHDGHTAIGLTVARILKAHQAELTGTLKLVFQPAEEGLGGAESMIADGVLENPRPDMALSLHLWNNNPLGWIGVADGPVMAASDIFRIRIHGKGGHGAQPHLTIDPILASAQVVTVLQSIVARNVSPLETAVVSVTTIHGGDAHNVIPSAVELSGTIRTFDPSVRVNLLERFDRVVRGVAESLGCQVEVEVKRLTPAVVNDPSISERIRQVAGRVFPESKIARQFQTMGSEDMAYMMQDVPGCYIFLGSANAEQGLDFSHHHPRFDFDEAALPRAAALMSSAVYDYLGENGQQRA